MQNLKVTLQNWKENKRLMLSSIPLENNHEIDNPVIFRIVKISNQVVVIFRSQTAL